MLGGSGSRAAHRQIRWRSGQLRRNYACCSRKSSEARNEARGSPPVRNLRHNSGPMTRPIVCGANPVPGASIRFLVRLRVADSRTPGRWSNCTAYTRRHQPPVIQIQKFSQKAPDRQRPRGPRLRCDCAVTSAVRRGVSEHPGIPAALKTQPIRPNWTELNWQPSGSIPVSATILSITYKRILLDSR